MHLPRLHSGRYAAVTATLALVVALSGTSYAAVKIGTAQLKDNAVTSVKIKNGQVTGADVNEATLAVVPNSDTAVHARSSGRLDSAEIVKVRAQLTTADTRPYVMLERPGLRIGGECDATVGWELAATSTAADGSIFVTAFGDSAPTPADPVSADQESGDFDLGDTQSLLPPGANGNINQVQLSYSGADGTVVEGSLLVDERGNECLVSGFLTVG